MKLSLDALKERAEASTSTELLATISGGLANACHDSAVIQLLNHDQNSPRPALSPLGSALVRAWDSFWN